MWVLATRFLKSRQRKSLGSALFLLSVGGICIGVTTLIVVMAVMNGFSTKLLHNVLGINGHVVIHCAQEDYRNIERAIQNLQHVVNVWPVLEYPGIIKSQYSASGALVRGLKEKSSEQKLSNYMTCEDADPSDEESIILGSRLAEGLLVDCGDIVTLLSSTNLSSGMGIKQQRNYRITGIFNVGINEYDGSLAFIKLRSAQKLFGYGDNNVQYLEVHLDDAELSTDIAKSISNALKLHVDDWKVLQGHYFHALELEKNAMFFILTLMVIVAAFNIVAGISVLVQNKIKAIAVLRTLGMSKLSVAWMFCLCGMIIGVIGTSLGCITGAVFALNIGKISDLVGGFEKGELFESIVYCLEEISAQAVLWDVIRIASLSIGISLVASLPPAIMAAYQDPVDILKYE